jgi:hypothetical protein
MSDASIPSRFGPAVKWAVTAIVLFVLALGVSDGYREGHPTVGATYAVLFIATFVAAVKWDAIAAKLVPWRKAVAITLVLLGAILLAGGAYLFGRSNIGKSDQSHLEWFSVVDALQRFTGSDDRFGSLEVQLKKGTLIARGFPFPAGADTSAPTVIDTARWQFLRLDRRDGEMGKAGGGMSTWVGVQIARPSTAPQIQQQEPQNLSYLKEARIYAGALSPAPLNPRFVAKFARAGQRARIYVDDRYYIAGVMGSSAWMRSGRLFLIEYKDFVADESADVAILTPFETEDHRKLWRWGPPTEKPDPKTTFQSHGWHQGRIALVVDDAPPEFFYFIVDIAAPDAPPNLIGIERFKFAQDWDAEPRF